MLRLFPVVGLVFVVVAERPACGVDRESFVKRVGDTDSLVVAMPEWARALKAATSEEISGFPLLELLGKFDPLWNDEHKLRQEVSRQFLARMQTVSPEALAAWQAALGKATASEPSKTNTLLFVIQQERVFDKAALQSKAAASHLARLKTLPAVRTQEFAELAKLSNFSAATHILSQDAVFPQDAFQEAGFRQLCDKAGAKLKAQ